MSAVELNIFDWFYYDETSPTALRWKVDVFSGNGGRVHKVKKDQSAGGHDGNKGYTVVRFNKQLKRVHRIIWEMFNKPTTSQIDHIDGNKTNNMIANLREVTNQQNCQNKGMMKNNTSGKTGVSFTVTKGTTYAVASWHPEKGRTLAKHFSSKKYGLLPAFKMACEYRDKMISTLNDNGESYTDRHGLK